MASVEAATVGTAVDFRPLGAQGLPVELLQHVSRFCALQDAARFHAVCKGWHDTLGAAASPFYPELCRRQFALLLCDPALPPYEGSWRRLFLSMVAITRPVYEILNEGATALDTLAHRLADPSAAMPGTEQERDGGGDGGAAAAAAPVAAAAGAGKGEEKAVGPETPWIRELFEAFMRATFRLGLKVHLRKLAHSPALEAYLQATGRILERHPLCQRCLDAFVARTDELAMHYDVWNGGFVEFVNVPWRRSAIAFTTDLYTHRAHQQPKEAATPPPTDDDTPTASLAALEQGPGGQGAMAEAAAVVCAPAVRRLALDARPGNAADVKFAPGIVASLDVTIGSTLEEAMELYVRPQPGVPPHHWWWFPTGRYPFHLC